MADRDNEFQDSLKIAAERKRALDFADLQNEMAGRETGRNSRFLGKDQARIETQRSKDRFEQAYLSALQQLLNSDPEYAARYREVMDLLRRAEIVTERALETARQDLQRGGKTLEDTQNSANRLPDGTRVYRDAQGNVWSEDGRRVEDDEREGIVWKDGAPSYEDYLKRKQTVDEARRRIEVLERYQVDVLGKSRERMGDEDNPPSQEDMDEVERDILSHPDPVARRKLEPQEVHQISLESAATPPAKPPI